MLLAGCDETSGVGEDGDWKGGGAAGDGEDGDSGDGNVVTDAENRHVDGLGEASGLPPRTRALGVKMGRGGDKLLDLNCCSRLVINSLVLRRGVARPG